MLYLWWINMKPNGLCWLSSYLVRAVFLHAPFLLFVCQFACITGDGIFPMPESHWLCFAGKKIDQCKVDPDEIMILKEPILDAKRIALTVSPSTPILILSVILAPFLLLANLFKRMATWLLHFLLRTALLWQLVNRNVIVYPCRKWIVIVHTWQDGLDMMTQKNRQELKHPNLRSSF